MSICLRHNHLWCSQTLCIIETFCSKICYTKTQFSAGISGFIFNFIWFCDSNCNRWLSREHFHSNQSIRFVAHELMRFYHSINTIPLAFRKVTAVVSLNYFQYTNRKSERWLILTLNELKPQNILATIVNSSLYCRINPFRGDNWIGSFDFAQS